MKPVPISQRGKLGNAGRGFGRRAYIARLRKELRDGYLRENETNLQLASEWFHLDDGAEQDVGLGMSPA